MMPDKLRRQNEKDRFGSKGLPGTGSASAQWLTILLFLFSSSLLFLWLFEWDRYRMIAGPRMLTMSVLDKALLFWLLLAKSLVWFLPLLVIWGLLVASGLRRTTNFVVNFCWVALFYYMTIDLVSVGFAGYHFWDYLPNFRDMFEHPEVKIWQWAGDRLTVEGLLLLAIFAVSGPVFFFCFRRTLALLLHRLQWTCSPKASTALTFAFVFIVLGLAPAMQLFQDRYALDRIYNALPLPLGIRNSFERMTDRLDTWLGTTDKQAISASLSTIGDPGAERLVRRLASFVRQGREADSPDSPADAGVETAPGTARSKQSVDPRRSRQARLNPGGKQTNFQERPWPAGDKSDEPAPVRLLNEALDPGPIDRQAAVKKPRLPNVILIIFESFRPSALGPGLMKELDVWTRQGLRLERHYSGSNCSHLGLFSLFYGRSALGYHETLDRKIPAQMLESLRESGYRITFLTAGEVKGFRRLGQWINDKSCDVVIEDGESAVSGMPDWPKSDRRKLEQVRSIVNNARDQPQFVFFYLLSSHYRYAFPPEFDILKESASFWHFVNPRQQIQNHMNRYSNALMFLQHELMKLFQSIDPQRNIVMITGDHGESMGEDGVFTHGSRMSEVQLRVPFAMVGPGIEPRTISTATAHTDVLPTLLHGLAGTEVPIRSCQGRDLIEETSPADEVSLVPANGPDWEGLMVIRGNKRMVFRTELAAKPPSIEFAGLVDESGQYELKVEPTRPASGTRP
ncbi:MAG: sulfatase-like hydrolase/transferase [Desulfomonile tiedjei]|nr:sulfatase-like hydrolase/transferase [Desulfomonile tiedjei]